MMRIFLLCLLVLAAGCSERRGVGVAGGGSWGSSGGAGSMMSLSIPFGL
jgi:hypothetical protein